MWTPVISANQYLPISPVIVGSGRGNLLLSFCDSAACVGRRNVHEEGLRGGKP